MSSTLSAFASRPTTSLVVAAALLAAVPVASAQIAPKPAEPATLQANAAMAKGLPFANRQDFDDAMRGFVATLPDALVPGSGPRPVWTMKPYDFEKSSEVPDSVNPSLWRQAQLNAIHGLFKVTERVYQVRGFDISNMTIVEGDTSLIVIDPLLSVETARAALDLYYAQPAEKAGRHGDLFARPCRPLRRRQGRDQRRRGRRRQGAASSRRPASWKRPWPRTSSPATPMSRRAQYQFGSLLPPGPRGQVDTGLGKGLARGTLTLIAPTDTIAQASEKRVIDGVEIEFRLVPGSEAPAEMLMYFPQSRVLDMAEDVTHNMHNLYTIRGAEVRDANLWSRYISDALETWGDRSDVVIAQHHWPVVGPGTRRRAC